MTIDLSAIPEKYSQPDPSSISYLPRAGVQLSYMGHAEITLALLEIDPLWNWEPCAVDPLTGGPVIVPQGKRLVMWAKLTVLDKSVIGVGTCDDNKGEPEKELIGDFLRNAAMRFGIATKLWSKADSADPVGSASSGGYQPARQNRPRTPQKPVEAPRGPVHPDAATDAQVKLLAIQCQKAGIEEANRVEFVGNLIGRPIKSTRDLTKVEASQAIDLMTGRAA